MPGCRPFTDPEIVWMYDYLKKYGDPRDALLFRFGVFTGFRITELLSIQIKQVFQHGKIVDLLQIDRSKMKKKLHSREMELHHYLEMPIKEYIRHLKSRNSFDADYFLFPRRGRPWENLHRIQAYRIIHNAANALGLQGKIGTHSMRKTFARLFYQESGENLLLTTDGIGHARPDSTVKYLSFTKREVFDTVHRIKIQGLNA